MKYLRICGGAASALALAAAGCGGNGGGLTSGGVAPLAQMATLAREKSSLVPKKIYVTNAGNSSLTTYMYDGTPTTPTITQSLNRPEGVAVDSAGKIYVANAGGNVVTTYDRFGMQTKPTIALGRPSSIAVDAKGKIYVVGFNRLKGYSLRTYNSDGSPTTPTIETGIEPIGGVAVDANGKIYLTRVSIACEFKHCYSGPYVYHLVISAYHAGGSPWSPTIQLGRCPDYRHFHFGVVAVDAEGKIYAVNPHNNMLTAYNPDGSPTKPVVKRLSTPAALTVDGNGKIYVANLGNNELTTYNPDGSLATPTITGLDSPGGVAVR